MIAGYDRPTCNETLRAEPEPAEAVRERAAAPDSGW